MIQNRRGHKTDLVLLTILLFGVVSIAGAEELTVTHSRPPVSSTTDPNLEGTLVEFRTPEGWTVAEGPGYIYAQAGSQDMILAFITERIQILEGLPTDREPEDWTAVELLEQAFILSGDEPPGEIQQIEFATQQSAATIELIEGELTIFFIIPSPGILVTIQAMGINGREETVSSILSSLKFVH
ncbi:MAG: hypothetical protein CL404_03225 [Acidimicrobiaceae bacterium]|nr:hypothetical protein [Acidimicrobiaceae bacterium]